MASRQGPPARLGMRCAVAVLVAALAARGRLAASSCTPPPGAPPGWLDAATPPEACTRRVCTGPAAACGRASPPGGAFSELALVFSDEFESPRRRFEGQAGDKRWTAMDLYYSSDYREWQAYKPDKVAVADGALRLTLARENSTAVLNSVNGSKLVDANMTSGMVQSWNKFCFTGGYVEFGIQLPGNAVDSGLWAAAWLQGNLGRPGYLRSTAGRWPYSYDTCEGSGPLEWSVGQPGQRTSACGGRRGRGAPEIDVLEYGIFPVPGADAPQPTFVHTMQARAAASTGRKSRARRAPRPRGGGAERARRPRPRRATQMAPVAPPFTSWMLAQPPGSGAIPGVSLPGAADPAARTYLGNTYGELSRPGFPRTGNNLTDTYTASSLLGQQHFTAAHAYGVLWEPGERVRWYLDGRLLFEVTKEALRAQANDAGQAVAARLIPVEAMSLVINLAMADSSWSRVSDALLASLEAAPAVMSVDYVRVWQRPGSVNVGCDPPGFPTAQEIACHRDEYLGPSDEGLWALGACNSITSPDNSVLMGVGVAVGVIGLSIAALSHTMRRAAAAAKAGRAGAEWADQRAAREAGAKPGYFDAAAGGADAAAAQLLAARPDLIALAACLRTFVASLSAALVAVAPAAPQAGAAVKFGGGAAKGGARPPAKAAKPAKAKAVKQLAKPRDPVAEAWGLLLADLDERINKTKRGGKPLSDAALALRAAVVAAAAAHTLGEAPVPDATRGAAAFRELGLPADAALEAGFTVAQLLAPAAGLYTAAELVGSAVPDLRHLRAGGVSVAQLFASPRAAAALTGVDGARRLRAAGFGAVEVQAGAPPGAVTLWDLRLAGYAPSPAGRARTASGTGAANAGGGGAGTGRQPPAQQAAAQQALRADGPWDVEYFRHAVKPLMRLAPGRDLPHLLLGTRDRRAVAGLAAAPEEEAPAQVLLAANPLALALAQRRRALASAPSAGAPRAGAAKAGGGASRLRAVAGTADARGL
ncbi:KRE6 [Scenedesmus sp. PABB004]|nr:KRE6 [Scenedesmus sp. PABB004]